MNIPTQEQLAHLAALLMVSDSQIARAKNDVAIRYSMDLWDAAGEYLEGAKKNPLRAVPPVHTWHALPSEFRCPDCLQQMAKTDADAWTCANCKTVWRCAHLTPAQSGHVRETP